MAMVHAPRTNTERPSTRQRIEALAQHPTLFEYIDKHPQSGIYDRFGKEWSRALSYVDGIVHQCSDAVDTFIWERSKSLTEEKLETEFAEVMKNEIDALLLHRMFPYLYSGTIMSLTTTTDKVVKAAGEIALAPSPAKDFMNDFRTHSQYESQSPRAANGELLSSYGKRGAPVPGRCATICSKSPDPAETAVAKWLMNPLITFVAKPFRSILFKVPVIRRRFDSTSPDIELFRTSTVEALARFAMLMVAILCATAAIFTLDVVKKRQLRILIMALYALAFALPIQFLGPSSYPLYTLVIS
jgi:hypothetical protein